jgi:hypothetical protein
MWETIISWDWNTIMHLLLVVFLWRLHRATYHKLIDLEVMIRGIDRR